ncbi:MAG: MlaD family protein [Candidatus Sulfotelmatobacter sp.]
MSKQGTEQSAQGGGRRNGHWVVIFIVMLGLATIGVFSYLKFTGPPPFSLRACFQDAHELRPGAAVRLAGVDIGRVRSVRAQPTDTACPAAVEMQIQTAYDLKIPRDSVAFTDTAGVLGETYLGIDSSRASGAAIENGGLLPSRP